MSKRIRNIYFLGFFVTICLGALGIIMLFATNSTKYMSIFLIMFFSLGLSINQAIYFIYTRKILSEKVLRKRSKEEINFCRVLVLMMSFLFFAIFCFMAIALMTHFGIIPLKSLDYSEIAMDYLLIAIPCFFIVIVVLFLFRKKIRL